MILPVLSIAAAAKQHFATLQGKPSEQQRCAKRQCQQPERPVDTNSDEGKQDLQETLWPERLEEQQVGTHVGTLLQNRQFNSGPATWYYKDCVFAL